MITLYRPKYIFNIWESDISLASAHNNNLFQHTNTNTDNNVIQIAQPRFITEHHVNHTSKFLSEISILLVDNKNNTTLAIISPESGNRPN